MAYISVENLKDEEYVKKNFIVMCTKNGVIKKTTLEAYSRPRANGIIAINVREGDELLEAKLTNGSNEVVLASKAGRAIRFNEEKVRPMGRGASGVRGLKLGGDKDEVVGMITVQDPSVQTVLVVSENGYGKRTMLDDEDGEAVYRITNRGGKGVKTLNVTEKTGQLISIKVVTDEDDLMIINKSGIVIRLAVENLRVMGRATQGVKLINLKGKDQIAAIAKVEHSDEEEETIEGAENVETVEGEDAAASEISTGESEDKSGEGDESGTDIEETDSED
jgi:DNA gyrase subunit A